MPRQAHPGDNLRWFNQGQEFYRVFGEWRCANKKCKKRWSSAYTWLLLSKWEQGYPAIEFAKTDYSQQECKKCHHKENKLTNAHDLEKAHGDLIKPHLDKLCAKCNNGHPCQKRNYFGY